MYPQILISFYIFYYFNYFNYIITMVNIKEYIKNYPIRIILALSILAIIFIMIGHIYQEQIQQNLKQEFFKFPECSFDWWSVSHAVLFGIFGFLLPNHHFSFALVGISWELFEDYLAANEDVQFYNCKEKNNQEKFWCNGLVDGYWYCNVSDIWVNMFGYIIGSAIRTNLFTW